MQISGLPDCHKETAIVQMSETLIGQRDAEGFPGTERFQIVRRLGAGAFGVVYEAWDREDKMPVALKVLRFAEADALYRFKKGIRALTDIHHPNLAALHGLESKDGWWFLSMELVKGKDFVESTRGTAWDDFGASLADSTPITSTINVVLDREAAARAAARADSPQERQIAKTNQALDFPRLRHLVAQLAQGLATLHRHGRLHRDIKPPNVMVTREDRVVLLDFGLVTELERWRMLESSETSLAGTPAYMAPELIEGGNGIAGSDWYSVGVMLYQVLTGSLPFTGPLFDVLHRKRTEAPPDPREAAPATPDDLAKLSLGLLATRPEERFGVDQIEMALGVPTNDTGSSGDAIPATSVDGLPFVGRHEALDALHDALKASRQKAVAVYVSGPSGMGKTALAHRFLEEAQKADKKLVVLPGRCYLQESVPYKALDPLIDALSRYLMHLPRAEVEACLPTGAPALARLFPVLRRVAALGGAPRRSSETSDPQGLRRRAFTALRELLSELADRRRVVLFIDDLQWGDVDSFHLLDELLRPPDPPPLLFVGCYRSEEHNSPFLQALERHLASLERRGGELRRLFLNDLATPDAEQLVRALAGSTIGVAQARAILKEVGGSPLLLTELVHYLRERGANPGLARPATTSSSGALKELITTRVTSLEQGERRLLEIIATSGKPVPVGVAAEAAGLTAGVGALLDRLHAARLIRRHQADDRHEVEAYHDRVREVLVTSLEAETLRGYHQNLALALEVQGDVDPETLAIHYQGAGDTVQALVYAQSAAEQAEETLAFERAARLFRMVIELEGPLSPSQYGNQIRLGHALANAGHSHEAAEILIGAVEHSGTFDPFEVQRDAAEQLLISGHIDRGLLILRHVLRTAGMEMEQKRWRALLNLRWMRWVLRWRQQRFQETVADDIDPIRLQQIDVCWSVEIGLCLVDVLHASHFHARHLLLALEAGEPSRVARGLAMEVFFGVMEGSDSRPPLIEARRLAERLGDPYIRNLADMAAGMRDCIRGNFRRSHQRLVAAEEHLREECTGVVWELDTAKHFRTLSMLYLGDWADLFKELPRLMKHAQIRGDQYLEVHLRQWIESRYWLCRDQPDEAAEDVRQAVAAWSYEGFHFQHFGRLVAEAEIALYQGEGAVALEMVDDVWPQLKRSMIQRLEMVLVLSHDLRGRAALATAVEAEEGPRRSHLLRRVRRDAQRLHRIGSPWAAGLAQLLLAGVATIQGTSTQAATSLEAAEEAFTTSDMKIHAAIVQRRSGQVLGIADQVRQADKVLGRQDIERPDLIARMLAPGWWRSST